MDLVISKKHTNRASRGNGLHCPAARAFKEAGFKGVNVNGGEIGEYYVFFDTESGRKEHKLPLTLIKAIEKFDDGEPFKIGTYRIAGLERPTKK